jgi:excisionase family DNA binding protein
VTAPASGSGDTAEVGPAASLIDAEERFSFLSPINFRRDRAILSLRESPAPSHATSIVTETDGRRLTRRTGLGQGDGFRLTKTGRGSYNAAWFQMKEGRRVPRTKSKPRPAKRGPANGPMADVLTQSEAAAYLRVPEPEVLRLVREQGLPARQAGVEWRFLLAAIRHWLSTGRPQGSNKEAWVKLAGVWRDDPCFEDFLREINKGRDLPSLEDQE